MKEFLIEDPTPVTLVELIAVLQQRNNQFIRVVWKSQQNNRLKKTGEGAAYKSRLVEKLYCATVRNNFNFAYTVHNALAAKGVDSSDWNPQERKWGEHIAKTPFVVHRPKNDEVLRLYGHFLPSKYYKIDGYTGYYVDGLKADDTVLTSLEYQRKMASNELDAQRQKSHPVNARLDDIKYIKAGKWYELIPPTQTEVETAAIMAA